MTWRRQRSLWQKIGFQQGDNESQGSHCWRKELQIWKGRKQIQLRSHNSAVQNHRGKRVKVLPILDFVKEAPGLKIRY